MLREIKVAAPLIEQAQAGADDCGIMGAADPEPDILQPSQVRKSPITPTALTGRRTANDCQIDSQGPAVRIRLRSSVDPGSDHRRIPAQ
jgi:hypothetical protein